VRVRVSCVALGLVFLLPLKRMRACAYPLVFTCPIADIIVRPSEVMF